jgi:hypothetical protein
MEGIRGRVEELRREIAEIQKRNLAFLQMPRPNVIALHDHERRQQICYCSRSTCHVPGGRPPANSTQAVFSTAWRCFSAVVHFAMGVLTANQLPLLIRSRRVHRNSFEMLDPFPYAKRLTLSDAACVGRACRHFQTSATGMRG